MTRDGWFGSTPKESPITGGIGDGGSGFTGDGLVGGIEAWDEVRRAGPGGSKDDVSSGEDLPA
jgi:hypothetical protein